MDFDYDGIDLDRHPWQGADSNAYVHEDGRRCLHTVKGRWVREYQGLGQEAECHRDHTQEA